MDGSPAGKWRDAFLALALAVFTFGSAWVQLQLTPLGAPPDEWAHLSHVDEIAAGGRLLPDYADSRLLSDERHGNYLGHPPLYYTGLGLTGRALDWDAVREYRNYRATSAVLVAAGVLLWVLAGRAFGVPPAYLLAMVAAINAVPMFPYLAGSVNNDNLAYLAVALAFYGVSQVHARPGAAYAIGASGLLVATLTKATAALFLLLFFCFWLARRMRSEDSPLRSRHFIGALLVVLVASAGYYVPTMLEHGTPLPRVQTLYSSRPPPADPIGFMAFTAEFGSQMLSRLPDVPSYPFVLLPGGALEMLFYSMLALPVLAWASGRMAPIHGRIDRNAVQAGDAFLLALLVTLVVHLVMVWSTYRAHGVLGGMQPRYYNYALPGLFLACFLRRPRNAAGRAAFVAFAAIAAALLAVVPAALVQLQAARVAAPTRSAVETRLVVPPVLPAPRHDLRYRAAPAGVVDAIVREGRHVRLSGWAIDAAGKKPASRVWIFVGGHPLGTADTGHARPDVANALKVRAAERSGFRARLQDLPADIPLCELHVAAEQDDGSLSPLPYGKCAAPPAQK